MKQALQMLPSSLNLHRNFFLFFFILLCSCFKLRIRYSQGNSRTYEKCKYGHFGRLFMKVYYTEINFSKNKKKHRKNSVLCDLAFDRAFFFRNVTFSFIVFSAKKLFSNFLRNVSVFQKTYFKVKKLKC